MTRAHRVESFDGTVLHMEKLAGGPGAPVLLCNAIGADLALWRKIVPELTRDRPLITWSYRGLHGSEEPVTERVDAAAHAEDAVAVLNALDVTSAFLLAWSSGAPIAARIAHDHPSRVDGVSFLCASIDAGIASLIRHFELAALLPYLASIGKYFHEPLHMAFRAFVRRPEIAGLVRQSGFIGPATDVQAVVSYLQEIAACNPRWLLRVYEGVARESYKELASAIEVPALVIGGRRDRWATPRTVEALARALPNSTVKMYPLGTHFLPDEYANEVGSDLNAFYTSAERTGSDN